MTFSLELRNFIKDAAQRKKILYSKIAATCGVSNSYFSRFMNQKAHLSNDQLFLLGKKLEVSEGEMERLLALNELESAKSEVYQEKIKTKLHAMSFNAGRPHPKAHKSLLTIEYYTNPLFQIVHMALELPRYQTSLDTLARRLALSTQEMNVIIEKLLAMSLIEKQSKRFVSKHSFFHLNQGDFLSNQNHQAWRVQALKRIRQSTPQTYQFSATIAGDKKSLETFRQRFVQLISEYSKVVSSAKSEMIYQINLDLFEILGD